MPFRKRLFRQLRRGAGIAVLVFGTFSAPFAAPEGGAPAAVPADSTLDLLSGGTPFARAMTRPVPTDLPATPVDTVIGGAGYKVVKIDSSLVKRPAVAAAGKGSGGLYTLQFEAVGNFDAAQKRRWALQSRSGYALHLQFDPPFYKIRGGSFDKKEAAEDAVLRLQDAGVTAIVIKLK